MKGQNTPSRPYQELTENLNQRSQFSLKSMILDSTNKPKDSSKYSNIIFTSKNDLGVIRNGGRFGAQFAPDALLSNLSKFSLPEKFDSPILVCDLPFDKASFEGGQEATSMAMVDTLKNNRPSKVLHIGGGHDFIFPFVSALETLNPAKIVVLNLDAHLDTRTDSFLHSGTPFRQMDNLKTPLEIIQYGIQGLANAKSNYAPFKNLSLKTFQMEECTRKTNNFSSPPHFLFETIESAMTPGGLFVLSLDCDAIHSSTMKAVSCVNPYGLPDFHVSEILDWVLKQNSIEQKYFGIYEFNPLYDDLSQQGARFLAHLGYQFFCQ